MSTKKGKHSLWATMKQKNEMRKIVSISTSSNKNRLLRVLRQEKTLDINFDKMEEK